MKMVVTGATGFVGRHLMKHLLEHGHEVRALARQEPPAELLSPKVQWVVGDMADPATWERLLEPRCTVFNLAYSAATVAADALKATETMVESCVSGGVSRLVHCSTVSVYGHVLESPVTETTKCQPLQRYGKIKLAVERTVAIKANNRLECSILRPSSVLGDGGLTLEKEISDLLDGSKVLSYLRACLFGVRRFHLVPVETVASALLYIAQVPLLEPAELFIVSDDEDPINNFLDIEDILRDELGVPRFPVPPLPVPRWMLEFLLHMMGRPNANTRTVYSSAKLKSRGFVSPVSLEQALRHHAQKRKLNRPAE